MITVYTSPTCGKCKALKAHLTKVGKVFNEVDITTDYKAHARLHV